MHQAAWSHAHHTRARLESGNRSTTFCHEAGEVATRRLLGPWVFTQNEQHISEIQASGPNLHLNLRIIQGRGERRLFTNLQA